MELKHMLSQLRHKHIHGLLTIRTAIVRIDDRLEDLQYKQCLVMGKLGRIIYG